MKRPYRCLVVAALVVAFWPAGSGLVGQPTGRPDLRIRSAGRTVLDDFRVRDGAVANDDTVILVGSTDGPEDAIDRDLRPNGWVLDLTHKTPRRRFTNGHSAPLVSVSVGHGMVATTSTTLDPVLRVSDLKTRKTVAEITLGEPDQFGNASHRFAARWLGKSPRLAVLIDKEIQILDPKAPAERTRYSLGNRMDRLLFADLAVAPDDSRIACAARFRQPGSEEKLDGVLVWGADRDNPTAVSIVPPKTDRPTDWRTGMVTIGPQAQVVARRGNSRVEVPFGTAEKDVPPERRGVVRIDAARERATPTGMGTSHLTLHCAFDPSGKWLAVVGTAHADGPEPKDDTFASELRVYEAATARLVHREQIFARMGVSWVGFSPSGKRICAASANGTLYWWDVERP